MPKKIKNVRKLPPKIKIIREIKKEESELEEDIRVGENEKFQEFISSGESVAPVIQPANEAPLENQVRTVRPQQRTTENENSQAPYAVLTGQQLYERGRSLGQRERTTYASAESSTQTSARPESQSSQQIVPTIEPRGVSNPQQTFRPGRSIRDESPLLDLDAEQKKYESGDTTVKTTKRRSNLY